MLNRTASFAARSLARHNASNTVRPVARLCTRGIASASDNTTSTDNNTNTNKLLDESIMEHLVCPISKLPLRYDAARGLIICPEIRVAYPIVNGVPMLVPTEGRLLRDDEEA